jgi:c-di-GMP-binding flagellar brake protein YcgR
MSAIETLARLVLGNRRRFPRKPLVYETTLMNDQRQILFRGKTTDISRGGARVTGLPVGTGVAPTQIVRVEFLVVPKKLTQRTIRAAADAMVWRVEEHEDHHIVALKFTRILDT